MASRNTVRVLMYSHDTYGLGHLTRTLRVAAALRSENPHASVLVLTGSPVAPYMSLPPGADLVKLPSVVKVGGEEYRSRDLEVDFRRIRKMRSEVIRSTARAFRPHLFLVDNVPTGMKGEVLPTLEFLRSEMLHTRTALILRDILDSPEVIRKNWDEKGVPRVLEQLYDRIFVLGDEAVYDAARAYGLPPDRTAHLGYAAPASRQASEWKRGNVRPSRVLLTVGGGGDGIQLLEAALEAQGGGRLRVDGEGHPLQLEIVTGPLMDADDRRRLADRAHACGARLYDFVPDMPDRMASADLVVSMAGYNTCCEIFSYARAALLVPRTAPRKEQWIRARALEAMGAVSCLEPTEATPERLSDRIKEILNRGPRVREEVLPRVDGLRRLGQELTRLVRTSDRGPTRECAGDAGSPGADRKPSAGTRDPRVASVRGPEPRAGRRVATVSRDPVALPRPMMRAITSDRGAWFWPGTIFPTARRL